MTNQPSARATGQEFISATVHFAGAVEVETGHVAHYSAEHVQARIGSVLIYFLDPAAVDTFAAAVSATEQAAPQMFTHPHAVNLPASLRHPGQDVSLVVRLRGHQETEDPWGKPAKVSGDGVAYVGCKVGGLRLLIRDAEAMHRLAHVAATVARVAAALWPVTETSDDATEETTRPRRQLAP